MRTPGASGDLFDGESRLYTPVRVIVVVVSLYKGPGLNLVGVILDELICPKSVAVLVLHLIKAV